MKSKLPPYWRAQFVLIILLFSGATICPFLIGFEIARPRVGGCGPRVTETSFSIELNQTTPVVNVSFGDVQWIQFQDTRSYSQSNPSPAVMVSILNSTHTFANASLGVNQSNPITAVTFYLYGRRPTVIQFARATQNTLFTCDLIYLPMTGPCVDPHPPYLLCVLIACFVVLLALGVGLSMWFYRRTVALANYS